MDTGTTVGDFRIEGRAGAGGMGVVYRARQLSLGRVVALKVLGGALADPAAVARFRRAASAAAKLTHPGIAAVHFVGQDAEVCYLAMEYVAGRSLQQVIQALTAGRAGSLDAAVTAADPVPVAVRFDSDATTDLPDTPAPAPPLGPAAEAVRADPAHWRRCAAVVRDAARALHHAHTQGVIHRDVKPGNLMVGVDGAVKVIDFGVARFFEDETLTVTGSLVGTPLYMSPEQVTGRLELTAATDIYSLGLVLVELLTLRPPVAASGREELLRRIVTKPLAPLRRANPAVPAELEAVAHRAAAKDPDDRYPSAAAFADDLQRWLDGDPVVAKPYRVVADEVEVAARRPNGLLGVYVYLAFCGMFHLLAASMATFVVSWTAGGRSGGVLMAAAWLAGGWCFVVGGGVLRGAIWGWWAAVVTVAFATAEVVTVFGVYFAQANGTDRVLRSVGYGVTALLVGLTGVCCWQLVRRRTREWFAFAARVRAEAAGR